MRRRFAGKSLKVTTVFIPILYISVRKDLQQGNGLNTWTAIQMLKGQ
jgi:hypothetical protein